MAVQINGTPLTLQATPNYAFNFVADGQLYNIALRAIQDMVFMDVTMNGAIVATALPCLVGALVIPYPYLEGAGGNFVFSTASGENPQWENFGAGDVLLYLANADLVVARAAQAAALTAIILGPGQAA